MSNEEKILEMLTNLTKTVNRQGEQLAKQGEQIAEMQETLTRVAVTQEAQVLPQFQLLFEGHSELNNKLDKLASKSRVEELEDDVAMLKDSVKLLRMEVNELKKAQ